jgi:glyoxylase-like metal-dependent hydrolase (beta-lactamase superfamily II)
VGCTERRRPVSAEFAPTSQQQFLAASSGLLPDPEEVAPDVWAIAAPIPMGQITHTLSYVLRDDFGRLHLIDPGWDSDHNLAVLTETLDTLGFRLDQIASTISTHHHPDHLGIAHRLRVEYGAQVMLSGVEVDVLRYESDATESLRDDYSRTLDRWGVPAARWTELEESFDRPVLTGPLTPDRALGDRELIEIPGHRLDVVGTPGHSGGHICLADSDRRILYSGDHVLPHIFSGIGIGFLPGTDPLADYYSSLARMSEFDEFEVMPGHEFRFRGLRQRSDAIAAHHRRRTNEVHELSRRLGDARVWTYAQHMTWTGGFDSLTRFSLHSALRQTEMHLALVRSDAWDVPPASESAPDL